MPSQRARTPRSTTGCASRARPPIRRSSAGERVGGRRRDHRRRVHRACGPRIALTDTDPSLRVVVLEAETVAFGASGRNGGFCEASLTHGLANGIRHFPDELPRLEREGIENLAALIAFTREHGIDCDLEETGTLAPGRPAVPGRGVPGLGRRGRRARGAPGVPGPRRRPGRGPLPAVARRPVPAARSRRARRPGEAVPRPRPGRPRAWGRRARADAASTGLERRAGGVDVTTAGGATVRADHVVVATSAYSGWLRRLSPLFVPVYDYVLVSEPLTPEQRASIGWERRQGLSTRTTSSTTSG